MRQQTHVRRFGPRRCAECGQRFEPTHGNQKLMPECALLRQRRHEQAAPSRRKAREGPTRKPLISDRAPDFLLAYPAMRAELARFDAQAAPFPLMRRVRQ